MKDTKLSEQEINRKRSQNLVPGRYTGSLKWQPLPVNHVNTGAFMITVDQFLIT